MCNTSDWIHCNKNPTLHRHPQNRKVTGLPFQAGRKGTRSSFPATLGKQGKNKSFFLSSCSFIWFSRTSMYLKLGTHFFFSRLKLSLAGVKLPIERPNGYLKEKKCASTKINEKRTCCKEPHFHRVSDGQNGTPLRTWGGGWGRRPQRPARLQGHPGQCKAVSNLKATREITFRESGAFGFCAQSAAGARRPRAPQRITQAEQQPSSPLGCAA